MEKVRKRKTLPLGFHYTLMCLPGYIWLFLFSIVPMVGIVMAFQNYMPTKGWFESPWVGFKWFKMPFENAATRSDIIRVLKNTLAMSGLGILTSWCPMVFAVFLAEIKNSKVRRVVQTLTTVPNFISWVLVYAIAFCIFGTEGFISSLMKINGLWTQGKNMLMGDSFIWLKNAGVALPTFCVTEPTVPLMLNKSANLFKLFLSDVGLLASMYMDGIQLKLLNREKDINFGSVYENAAAQELKAHGYDLYYFNSKKQGELDFVIERGGDVLPIEIKSGKDYQRHAALDNVLGNKDYAIPTAFVFQNDNVSTDGRIVYLPIYMLMFLQKEEASAPQIYKLNLDGLK